MSKKSGKSTKKAAKKKRYARKLDTEKRYGFVIRIRKKATRLKPVQDQKFRDNWNYNKGRGGFKEYHREHPATLRTAKEEFKKFREINGKKGNLIMMVDVVEVSQGKLEVPLKFKK